MPNLNEELSRCVIILLMDEPFFSHFLAGVTRTPNEDIPTLAVTLRKGHPELVINEQFFLKKLRRQNHRVGVLKHEVLHLVFKHLFRMSKFGDRELFNIAADLVVNQYIGKWGLPDGAVLLSSFPDLELEKEQDVDYYYKQLLQLNQQLKDSDRTPEETDAPESARSLKKLYGATGRGVHQLWDLAGMESAFSEATESELERMAIQAWERSGPRHWGSIPGPISNLIKIMIQRLEAKIDWKRALRIFSSSSRRTRIVATMKKPSRRFGTFPGVRVKRFQHLAVIVDTSGSIDKKSLEDFFAEIHGMWRVGAEVDIIEADAAVQRVYRYDGSMPEGFSGRGGTVFDPAFEWLRDNRSRQFDAAIYLTDGYADEPSIPPPCRLLWVVTKDGSVGDHLKYGKTIQLN